MASGVRALAIEALRGRLILDSHLAWTPEFEVRLADGRVGRASAPRGETVSTLEAEAPASDPEAVLGTISALVGRAFDQASFDRAIEEHAGRFGRQAVLALSAAFHEATRAASEPGTPAPRLLMNLLNGGLHAYTNPVAADMPEFMLYPRAGDLRSVADAYVGLLGSVRERLRHLPTAEVGGNPVRVLGDPPNEAAFGFVEDVLRTEGLDSTFGIAVDASAGDWATAGGYGLPVSGRRFRSGELVGWWLELIDRFGLVLLEDPFGEHDRTAWQELHARRPPACRVLGDNYTSTDLARLTGEGRAAEVDGVLVKPNQRGTVSGALEFATAARTAGLMIVASHRSVETESMMLVSLAREMRADAIKIGPFRDFTAVIKFNELLRERDGPWPA